MRLEKYDQAESKEEIRRGACTVDVSVELNTYLYMSLTLTPL